MRKFFVQLLAFVNISLVCLSLVSCNPIDEPGGGGNNGGGNNSSNNGDNGSGDKKLTLEAVDMGLPSGLLWANESLLDLNYRYTADTYRNRYAFAWGRVSPQNSYSEHYYLEEDIENISGNIKYDAATKLCGDGWRIPTAEEWEELIENCKCSAEYHSALTLTSKINGNTLEMPANGILTSYAHTNKGGCWYWSATSVDRRTAYAFVFCQGLHVTEAFEIVPLEKGLGIGVIPVRDPD